MVSFMPADILIPNVSDMRKWSVIACDQFTSDPEYWKRVKNYVGNEPSTLRLILPEAELGTPEEEAHTDDIHVSMKKYLDSGIFREYKDSFVYVERSLENGTIRRGLVGKIDLEQYDFHQGSKSDIRATELTVVERIPPRQKVRRNAAIELPHVLMLCDDHEKKLIEPISEKKDSLPKLYDFDLMEGGGHISGWLVDGNDAEEFQRALEEYYHSVPDKYHDLNGVSMTFAVGDGNHSLATAKSCYEELKANDPSISLCDHPARYALVELENIHDEAQIFEPIHRVITETDPELLLKTLSENVCAENGFEVKWFIGSTSGTVSLDPQKGQLAVGILQSFLDEYLKNHDGTIDYIHDDDELIRLSSQDRSIGFLLPAMEKSQLFRGVIADGVLPRKTFSMGHAREKRYYLEGRKIK